MIYDMKLQVDIAHSMQNRYYSEWHYEIEEHGSTDREEALWNEYGRWLSIYYTLLDVFNATLDQILYSHNY